MKKLFLILILPALMFGPAFAADNKPALNAGAGGGAAASASYRLTASVSQPASANLLSTGNYVLGVGFMQALLGFESISTDIIDLDNTVDNYFCLERTFGRVCITVPAGTYSQSVTFLADIPATYPDAVSRTNQIIGTPIGVRTRTVPVATPGRAITYEFFYNASALGGVTDESRLSLQRYLPEETRWLAFDNATRDAAADTITVKTPAVGILRALEVLPGAGVGDPFVYPNPFMPKNGDTIMRITNIPAGAKIEIYTITGRAVRELTADSSGLAVWDTRNDEGTLVASGIYLAILRSGGEKHTTQLAVQR